MDNFFENLQDVAINDGLQQENVLNFVIFGNPLQEQVGFRSRCLSCIQQHLSSYVWQKNKFDLVIDGVPKWVQVQQNRYCCLWGSVEFGDCIDDEWFCTYLLFQISQQMGDEIIGIQVWDNDGDFLLIEAAYGLPQWVEPDIMKNRVWIKQGQIHLIKPSQKSKYPLELSQQLALQEILSDTNNKHYVHSVQQLINNKINEYPQKSLQNTHSAICCIPQKLAYLINQCPWSVSHAVDALCDRDVLDMEKVQNMNVFQPDQDQIVTVAVKFSRCSYAKAVTHEFLEPYMRTADNQIQEDSKFKAAQLGMKLSLGFEILVDRELRDYQQEKSQNIVENFASVKQQLINVLHKKLCRQPGWQKIVNQVQNLSLEEQIKQYLSQFGDVLKGRSQWIEVSSVLQWYEGNKERVQIQESSLCDGDEDGWLREGMGQLDEELKQREKEQQEDEERNQNNIDAEELVQKFEDFMNSESDIDGAEIFSDFQFDPNKFWKELEKGLNGGGEEDDDDHSSVSWEEEENEEVAKQELQAAAVDDELKEQWEVMTGTDSDDDEDEAQMFQEQYDAVMRQQLQGTKAGLNQIRDLKTNLVDNFVKSMNEQEQFSGPASNMTSMLGINLETKNKTESNNEQNVVQNS